MEDELVKKVVAEVVQQMQEEVEKKTRYLLVKDHPQEVSYKERVIELKRRLDNTYSPNLALYYKEIFREIFPELC